MLPDFICIGAGRAGTSWLYEMLREHPEIFTARDIKETHFFDDYYDRGSGIRLDGHLKKLVVASPCLLVGIEDPAAIIADLEAAIEAAT